MRCGGVNEAYVKKSIPARDLISPVCSGEVSIFPKGARALGTYVTEGSTHDNSLVAVLLVVIEDLLDGLHTRVFITLIVLAGGLLVPVKNLEADQHLIRHA